MQKTRQKIIEYLREHGEATVDELSEALGDLTAVTVRHHLDVLRSEGLVGLPLMRHRDTPGRPKYVYRLTEKAEALFPKNVGMLATHMLAELKEALPPEQVNVIFLGVAERMASALDPSPQGEALEQRLDRVAEYLSRQGYEARWEAHPNGYVLHTGNCPYRGVVEDHEDLCLLDLQYISRLVGTTPQRLEHLRQGGRTCSYFIPLQQHQSA